MSLRMRLAAIPALAALTFGLAAVPAPAAHASHVDPAAPGSYAWTSFEYDGGIVLVTDFLGAPAYPEELVGSVHLPTGTGPFPVVVLEHGRHSTCAVLKIESLGWPCPDTSATENIRSYRGYDYLAQNLASHGYLVVSVSANSVNTYDTATIDSGATARAQVIDETLDKLVEWNTTAGPGAVGSRLIGKVDVSRLGLMGHSRGGEGVTTFIDYNRTTLGNKWSGLKAVLALAATDFNLPPSHGVNFGTILALCDGDVYDLQGANAYDRGRFVDPNTPYARVQWTVNGTNHNYFNTLWTDDDWDYSGLDDPACNAHSPQRLNATDQRRVGLALMASFLRRYVGGETAFDGLMTGADALPSSACPGGSGSCAGLVRTSYLAPAAGRQVVVVPADGATGTTTTATGQPITATGFVNYRSCRPSSAINATNNCPTDPTRSGARQLVLTWTGAATLRAGVSATGLNVSAFADTLTFRTGVNYNDPLNVGNQQDVQVVLFDAKGNSSTAVAAAAHSPYALQKPAGTANRQLTLNGVRIPLSAFGRVDKTRITAIELRFGGLTSTGSIQLAELGFQDS